MKTLEQAIEEIKQALRSGKNGEGPESELFDLYGDILEETVEDFEQVRFPNLDEYE